MAAASEVEEGTVTVGFSGAVVAVAEAVVIGALAVAAALVGVVVAEEENVGGAAGAEAQNRKYQEWYVASYRSRSPCCRDGVGKA